jgi:hypothetical protein
MIDVRNTDEIIDHSFGLSIYSLFMNIGYGNDGIDFQSHKEGFFQILGNLLKMKKIMLTTPGVDVYRTPDHIPKFSIYDKEAQWNISPENAVQYF